MRRWVAVGVVGLILLFVVGLALVYIADLRAKSQVAACQNNFRELWTATLHADAPAAAAPPTRDSLTVVPAGTVLLANTPPDERLSWFVQALPGLNQKRDKADKLLAAVDRNQPWAAGPNQAAARTPLRTLLCPGNPAAVAPDAAAPTQYLGMGGVGLDAPTLPVVRTAANLGVFGRHDVERLPPRAGCFRYDSPTPARLVTDGLSHTFLLVETSNDVGPWLRGGPATVRGVDTADAAKPLLGAGSQFGGNHPHGSNVGFADGGLRFLSDRTDPAVFRAMATAAGGENEIGPGE